MRKKKITILLLYLLTFAAPVLALDMMGPPSAQLRKGGFSAGVDYSYSKMDVKLSGGKGSWAGFTDGVLSASNAGKMASLTIDRMELNKVYANIGYGLTDNWQVSFLLGGANIDFGYDSKATPLFPVPVSGGGGKLFDGSQNVNGDNNCLIGFGSKVTFCQWDKLKLGGLFQATWARSESDKTQSLSSGGVNGFPDPFTLSHSVDVKIIEIQIALGPTYQLNEKVSFYGGPFLHIVDGKVEGDYSESGTAPGPSTLDYHADYSYDIDKSSIFGGYVGLQVDLDTNLAFNIEYQHTAYADALGLNLLWVF